MIDADALKWARGVDFLIKSNTMLAESALLQRQLAGCVMVFCTFVPVIGGFISWLHIGEVISGLSLSIAAISVGFFVLYFKLVYCKVSNRVDREFKQHRRNYRDVMDIVQTPDVVVYEHEDIPHRPKAPPPPPPPRRYRKW